MTQAAYAALTLVIVSSILLGATAIADEGLAHTGERTDIVDESFTPQGNTGQFITLDNSNSDDLTYSDDVEVKNKDGNHSIEGADYEWNSDNGTIKPLAGGNLEGDTTATINYTIWNPTQQDDDVADTVVTMADLGQWIPLVLLVALVLLAISTLGGLS